MPAVQKEPTPPPLETPLPYADPPQKGCTGVDLIASRVAASQQRAIVAHYERVAPLIVANFPTIPLVFAYHPDGLDKDGTFSNLDGKHIPHGVPHVPVLTSTGRHIYPGCALDTILTYVHAYADGVHAWTPTPLNPDAVAFARIQCKPIAGATPSQMREALITLRAILCKHGLDAIPLYEGTDAALFIPLADAPAYDFVRAWLHCLVNEAIAQQPQLLTGHKYRNVDPTETRIALTVSSNAPGEHSRLPYTLTGNPDLPLVTPFDWSELDTLRNGHYTVYNAEERLAKGDIFATLAAKLAHQTFAAIAA